MFHYDAKESCNASQHFRHVACNFRRVLLQQGKCLNHRILPHFIPFHLLIDPFAPIIRRKSTQGKSQFCRPSQRWLQVSHIQMVSICNVLSQTRQICCCALSTVKTTFRMPSLHPSRCRLTPRPPTIRTSMPTITPGPNTSHTATEISTTEAIEVRNTVRPMVTTGATPDWT